MCQHLSQLSKDLTTRERRQVVPGMKDESSWFQFCLGGTLAEADGSRDEEAANTAAILESIEGMYFVFIICILLYIDVII